jgi:signal transduction histidine kinase
MKSNPPKAEASARPTVEGEGRRGWRAILASLSVDTLRWSLGLFCAVIGAFMLVAPHQFESAPSTLLSPYLAGWGLIGLTAGIALLSVPVTRPAPAATAVIQGIVGMALLGLAFGFARAGAWTGGLFFLVLGAGAPFARERPARRRVRDLGPPGGDFLALLLGIAETLAGIAILGAGTAIVGHYDTNRALVPYFGGIWVVAGPLLVRAQIRPLSRWETASAHGLGGLSLLAFGLLVALPGRAWTGIALYCGGGLVIALLPWLRPLLAEVDSAALRTRLSLALALATSVTLILAVAVVTDAEERLAAEGVRQMQKVEADSIAQNVVDYLDFNIARATVVASLAGRHPLTAELQTKFLERTRTLYPDVAAFATASLAGEPLAQTGDLPLDRAAWRRFAGEIGRQTEPLLVLHFSRQQGRPLLLLTAGISGPAGGRPVGLLVIAFDTTSLSRRIDRPGSRVTLANGRGQIIASRDQAGGNQVAPLPAGWDRAVIAGERDQGGASLAAFATVPRIGWALAVERPRATALAGVRRGRDMAFVLLLVCGGLAALAGIVTGRRIAHPLGTLADAVDQLAAGNPRAPVPASAIAEVARLAAAFRELRDRLMARTAESERLAAELLARAEALAEADRRKDEFLAMLAHELRNPLGAIANASHLLGHLPAAVPPTSPASHAAAVIERQVQHLVRMVDDLLDVSRITRGKVELRREPLDLVEVVRQTVESNRALVEGRGITLEVTLPPDPLPLDADLTRLEQVLANLLRNSAKFTDPGGRIAVSVAAEGGEAVVRVADTGIGIAPELLPRVFDLFTQGEQGLDRGGAGLGIGLTMVRRLVELHGGRVEAASAGRGRGAELTLWLPFAPSVDVQIVQEEKLPVSRPGVRRRGGPGR